MQLTGQWQTLDAIAAHGAVVEAMINKLRALASLSEAPT
jgi:hypothetical protein